MEKKFRTKCKQQRVAAKKAPQFSTNFKTAAPTVGEDSAVKSTAATQPNNMTVDYMTSRDFQLDTHAHIDVATQLLKDQVRIRNFQAAIGHNQHLFRGKIVLDIGCGAGILSLFVAKAGAARVFAVDPSSVVDYTRKIVRANNYEHIIEVIKGRIEEICLPVKQIDIIVCDWMGYSLLYQSTCEAVIFARDKWLRRDTSGLIFPDVGKLYIAAIEDSERKNEKIEWWKNVYGFNMKCMREFALKEPSFHAVLPEQIVSTGFNIKTLNLYTATCKDLGFRSKYMLRMLRSGLIDGVVTYFQIHFSKSHTPMCFTTDPWSAHTHWMQSVFFFDQPMPINDDEVLCGGFEMIPADCEQPNMNNMEAALELYYGKPMQLQVEMRWQLKPHAATVIANSNTHLPQKEPITATDTLVPKVTSVPIQIKVDHTNNVAEKIRKKNKSSAKKG